MSRKNSLAERQSITSTAQELQNILGQLEIKNHDLQPNEKFIKELPDLIQKCYELHQQLENFIVQKQKKHIYVSSQEINMLENYHKRIDYQEEHLFEYIKKHGAINKIEAEKQYNQMLNEFRQEKKQQEEFKNKYYNQIIEPPKFDSQIHEEYQISLIKSNSMLQNEINQKLNKQQSQSDTDDNDFEKNSQNQQLQQQQIQEFHNNQENQIQELQGFKISKYDSEEIQKEKLEKIQKLSKECEYLKSIQQDFNIETEKTNEKVENIVKQSEQTLQQSKQTTEEMRKAHIQAQENRKLKVKSFFMTLLGIFGLGACGPSGAAIGVGAGTIIGHQVGKSVTDGRKHTELTDTYSMEYQNNLEKISNDSDQENKQQ